MVDKRVKDKAFSIFKFALGWPISLIAIFFLGKTFLTQTANISEHLQTINLSLLIPGILCFLAYYFLRSFVWFKLIEFAGHRIDSRESLFLWSFTQLRRYIPGNIWAALGVATQYSKKGIPKRDIGTFILWESEGVVLACLLLSALGIPFLSKHFLHLGQFELLATFSYSLLIVFGVFIFCFNRTLFTSLKGKLKVILEHTFPSFAPYDSFASVIYLLLSFIFLGFGYFLTIASLNYLDPNLIWQFIGFFTLSLLVGFVSVITPSGLGVREGVLTLFLGTIMPIPLAAFVSLFCRLILIICEVVFVGIAYLVHKSRIGRLNYFVSLVTTHTHETVLVISTTIFAWYFIAINFLRYENYYTGRFDLGNMSQTVWNTLHGRIFEFSNPNGVEPISRLAFHADVILIAFSPFYLIWSDPRVLLFFQVLIVGFGSFFLYAIAVHLLKSKSLALTVSFLYLVNPSLQRSIIYDFHAVTLATTFLLAAMYFVFKKNYRFFVIFAVLAGMCKEQVWAVTGLMGLYIALIQKQWKLGCTTFVISAAIALSLVWYVIPHAAGGEQHFALEYYASSDSASDSPTKLIEKFILSPHDTISLMTQESRVVYLKKLLEPLGYIPLLSPLFLIFILPDLSINILSSKSELYQIYYQYTAVITPFLFIALIAGLAWLLKKFRKIPQLLAISYLLFTGLLGAYRYGPLPGMKEPNTDMFTKPYPNRKDLDALIASIPERASVSTTNSIGSHLAHRQNLYNVPFAMESADFVIIDNSDDNLPDPTSEYATKSAALKADKAYYLFYKDENVSAFRRVDF